ncbi:hypothetical protein COX86_01840 [Candidatus Micrarchaeota archaeon CG_4_10_14_0_2_um_filter_60_11]|nr:MAG: hypothetical protein AUJ16_03215 [Candidatus Micrarchaeota archaeon CG1_02_60_51]PIN96251.1 MAG: hypothetical protein COU39_02170 [Candidatus Micrarchaeota archaeon CG10_big_fil_rev_8_21_14_0_10_60_32]PIO02262.1 MAG: hypothetical protein COT58_00955 [Candidatus Micrarchaeota archaeon CG09_land_8_20_14_0_10_60_16]PIY91674.1 MAG: hypothetical protein COY71_01915 [Candidatus Micrarchaeota archaeon CG_4_10_14_0_8_um_filter_60_7]PIZ91011.1 MAG: hypothetical protein COX86_01840 [Candidatus Mi
MKRVETGARGLDELLGGGLLHDTATLVTGACGTGKTVFCLGFLRKGAALHEPGVLACFNESPAKIRGYARSLGWDVAEAEKKRLLLLVDASSARSGFASGEEHVLTKYAFDDALNYVLAACAKVKAKRLAIDSLSTMLARSDDKRKALFMLSSALERARITAVLASEPLGGDGEGFVEEHLADTVIALKRCGEKRLLEIRKHRGSAHSMHEHAYKISEGGIAVDKAELTL